jgi:hypothetical protein
MRHNKGLSTLTALMVITSILLASGIALHISLRQSLSGFTVDLREEGVRSRVLSCLYEGWYQLTQNINYTGATLSLDSGSCTIVVTKQGNTYMITAESLIPPNHLTYTLTIKKTGNNLTVTSFQHTF